MGALALSDLRVLGGEPRIADHSLAQTLGYLSVKKVRQLISRHYGELTRHGEVWTQSEAKPQETADSGGRPATSFLLNEPQTLLVCMFSRTNAAAEVRRQVIEVFMAWRRGELERTTPPQRAPKLPDRKSRWASMEKRIAQLERMITFQGKVETPAFARALAYAPNILFLDHDDGRRRRQSRPKWWYDLPVREAVIEHHRQMTIDKALASLVTEFGRARAPSRSSLHRFWMTLDLVRAPS